MSNRCGVVWCRSPELHSGLCSTHYHRQRNHGNPWWGKRECRGCGREFKYELKRYSTPKYCVGCRIRSCDWCGRTYKKRTDSNFKYCSQGCAWKGSVKEKNRRACKNCGAEFVKDSGTKGLYCSRPCSDADVESWHNPREPTYSRDCVVCGGEFYVARSPYEVCCSNETCIDEHSHIDCEMCGRRCKRVGSNHKYCSSCKPEADRRNALRIRYRRIARERCGEHEDFDHQDVFERDGWVCQICGKAIDRSLSWPDPYCATLDHIIPLHEGGNHVRRNVQAAHFRCNRSKADGSAGSQLLLVG